MTERTDAAEVLSDEEKDALWEAIDRAFLDTSTFGRDAEANIERVVASLLAAREAAARAEALREAADAINSEPDSASCTEGTDEAVRIVEWLRDRAASIARTDGAGS